MYAEQQLVPWLDALRTVVPGARLHDAHVHVGTSDPSGYEVSAEEVVDSLALADSRGVVFPLSEPGGYRRPNRDALALAERHPDRLVALARIDPGDDPTGEAERCLSAGARGIKLHPRGDGFEIDDRRLDDVFALADRQRSLVMVHAGVGSPEVGDQAVARARAHPGARIILAHGAVGTSQEVVARIGEIDNLFVDTSWWNISDVWALFRLVPPSSILHASDVPFNSPTQAALMSGRLALQAGLSTEQVEGVLGGNLTRLLDGEDVAPGDPPPEHVDALPPELERLYVTLTSAVVPMLAGDEPGEALELARASCSTGGECGEAVESVSRLLQLAEECEGLDPLRPLRHPGFDLVLTAALVARTPDVPLPPI